MQDDALCRKFLFDRTRHNSSPFGLTSTRRTPDRGPLYFAHRAVTCKRGQIGSEKAKNTAIRLRFILFRDVAAVAAQWRGE
jgi:hypothetical protein